MPLTDGRNHHRTYSRSVGHVNKPRDASTRPHVQKTVLTRDNISVEDFKLFTRMIAYEDYIREHWEEYEGTYPNMLKDRDRRELEQYAIKNWWNLELRRMKQHTQEEIDEDGTGT